MQQQNWFTVQAVSDYLNLSTKSIRMMIKTGQLKSTKPQGKILVHRKWADSWAMNFGKKLTPNQQRELETLNYPCNQDIDSHNRRHSSETGEV